MQNAISLEGLDGWLFCNFRCRDKLSNQILHIPESSNSRFWYYAVPVKGEPLRIVHSVEPEALETLPGSKVYYTGRESLKNALKPLAGKSWGVHISDEIPAISYMDAGTANFLRDCGLKLVTAAALIQRFCGILDEEMISSHERSAVHLHEIVNIAWDFIKKAYHDKKDLFEGDIRQLMIAEMEKRNVIADPNLIVAAGVNSGNPHYNFTGKGAQIRENDLVLLDIWTKEKQDNAIYADISWAGVFAEKIPQEMEKRHKTIINSREAAISFINNELQQGKNPTGASVDIIAREVFEKAGYKEGLKHRTGHGIDTENHGSGVNIDSVEFPDSRLLLEGSCFSLEPGLYFSDFGMRTEVDVYIKNNTAIISGNPHKRQFALLTC